MALQCYIPYSYYFRRITIQLDAFCNLFVGQVALIAACSGDGGQGLFVEWPICNTEGFARKPIGRGESGGARIVSMQLFEAELRETRLSDEQKPQRTWSLKMERSSWQPCNGPKLLQHSETLHFGVIMVASSLGAPRTARCPLAWLKCNS